MTDLLTNSRMKTARRCLREERLTYLEQWRALNEAAALRFGDLFHHGLEAWWLAMMRGEADMLTPALDAISGEADPFDLARADALLRGYDARWSGQRYEVIAVEHEFRVPLINPETGAASRTFTLGGKMDALVRDADGQVLVVEHKTSSESIGPGSEYMRRLQIDGQVSTYYAAAQDLGHDVAGCLYDVIGKPGMRPLKATPIDSRKYKKDGTLYAAQRDRDETPEEFHARLVEDIASDPNGYFQRANVVRLEDELDEARADAWMTAEIIRDAKRRGKHPRNPDACSRFGRTCSFFDVCCGTASLDDASRFVKLTTAHPELSTTAADSSAA